MKSKEYYLKKQKELQERIDSGEDLSAKYLPEDAPESDKIKYKICQNICRLHNSGFSLKEISTIIGCDIITAKLIVYSHYDKFAMEFLVNAYDKLANSKRGQLLLKVTKAS